MSEPRYNEEQVREIFELAAKEEGSNLPASSAAEGLTLAEMQSIALEVGFAPELIARAASVVETRGPQQWRKSWGMPTEVGMSVPLQRAPTDLEWEQLVAELRTTFGAKGKISTYGSLREWRNGNLHASVEPTENGYRLRLGTRKGSAKSVNVLGAAGIAVSYGLIASLAVSGNLIAATAPDILLGPIAIGTMGIGALASNWFRLARWAERREEQMNHIAARIRAILK